MCSLFEIFIFSSVAGPSRAEVLPPIAAKSSSSTAVSKASTSSSSAAKAPGLSRNPPSRYCHLYYHFSVCLKTLNPLRAGRANQRHLRWLQITFFRSYAYFWKVQGKNCLVTIPDLRTTSTKPSRASPIEEEKDSLTPKGSGLQELWIHNKGLICQSDFLEF